LERNIGKLNGVYCVVPDYAHYGTKSSKFGTRRKKNSKLGPPMDSAVYQGDEATPESKLSYSLDGDSRANGAEADVGPDDLAVAVLAQIVVMRMRYSRWILRVGELGLDLGGHARVLGAVATVAARGAGLLGRVAGVEPEHVGVVLS
jgi:hypothetical protein